MLRIAFLMLVGDKGKYIGMILGVAFASFIMTQQPGIFSGIMERTYSLISDIDLPDIWVMDNDVDYIDDAKTIPETSLYRVASVEGIAWAKPMHKGNVQVRLKNGHIQNCNLIGIDDATLIGGPGLMVKGSLDNLRKDSGIIVNEEGANEKLSLNKEPLKIGDKIEINDNYAVVVGVASTSRTFQSFPVIYTTYSRAKSFVPPQRNTLTYILVKAKEGQDLKKLCQNIKKRTNLAAYTKQEFKQKTFDYYMKNTGIPINFGTSVLLGFIIGAAVAGQTFYSFITSNLRYFGLLKAMGIESKRLLLMVLLQASVVGCLGYGLGSLGTFIFAFASQKSMLAFSFSWSLLFFSFLAVMIICLFSAFLGIRKVFKIEPAIVFS